MRGFNLFFSLLLVACAKKTENKPAGDAADQMGPIAIEARSGSSLTGNVTMKAVEGGVEVKVEVENVSPGKHGVHVHELGDCSAEDAKSAGDHFNPAGHAHGLPGAEQTHLGDLGNVDVGEDGKGSLVVTKQGASLAGANELSFRGRSLIVHEKEDTGAQPSGDAGSRIGCAVLGG